MASFGDYNRVNTNVTAMDARLSLNKINKQLGDSRLKLSTGFKINNAEDDAAGFAIATKLKSRVAGLEQGLQNVSDAKSVLDVAEGAYSTVVDNLIEMKSLATQASNGTIAAGSDEMKYIASQLEALAKDINDISESTTYNGIDLMDSAQSLTFQVGEGTDDTMDVTLNKVNMASLFQTAGTSPLLTSSEVLGATTGGGTSDNYVYDGSAPSSTDTGQHLFNAIDSDLADSDNETHTIVAADDVLTSAPIDLDVTDTDLTMDASSLTSVDGYTSGSATATVYTDATASSAQGGVIDVLTSVPTDADTSDTIITMDASSLSTGSNTGSTTAAVYTDEGSTQSTDASTALNGTQVIDSNSDVITLTDNAADAAALGATAGAHDGIQVINSAGNVIKVTAGASVDVDAITGGAGETILVREDDATANSSLLFIDEDNVNGADMRAFIGHIDTAIGTMNENLNQIGIDQRSLSNKEVNLSEAITSNSAARSRIMDTDFAKEQSNSIRLQILQQTATAALSQANMGPQAVLSFLG